MRKFLIGLAVAGGLVSTQASATCAVCYRGGCWTLSNASCNLIMNTYGGSSVDGLICFSMGMATANPTGDYVQTDGKLAWYVRDGRKIPFASEASEKRFVSLLVDLKTTSGRDGAKQRDARLKAFFASAEPRRYTSAEIEKLRKQSIGTFRLGWRF